MKNKKEKTKVTRVTISVLERLLKARNKVVKDEAKERAVIDAAMEDAAERFEKRAK